VVASYVILDELGPDRQLIRIATGRHAGLELVLLTRDLMGVARLADVLGEEATGCSVANHPDAVAERLLLSLLDAEQRQQWKANRTFWVDTPYGRLRLGRLYDLYFRPRIGNALTLCVVPVDHLSLPRCDIWTNLVLALRADPERFFRVANWRPLRGAWQAGPVPLAREQPPAIPPRPVRRRPPRDLPRPVQATLF
jgi:hypothetical protein